MFITFEGIEGSGKTTQMGRLAEWLRARDRHVVVTREPGGTEIGQLFRRVLLEPRENPIDPITEVLVYSADRRQHVVEVIQPALKRAEIVLCDRFTDSTLAYQGFGRRISLDYLRLLNSVATDNIQPEITVFLDVTVDDGLTRAQARNLFTASSEGRFEAEELAFHRRVHEGYLSLIREEPARYMVIDGAGKPDVVFERMQQGLAERAPEIFR
jgi:dTMP kinase